MSLNRGSTRWHELLLYLMTGRGPNGLSRTCVTSVPRFTDLSFVARSEDEAVACRRASPDTARQTGSRGRLLGAGAGLLFGLAALAIPGGSVHHRGGAGFRCSGRLVGPWLQGAMAWVILGWCPRAAMSRAGYSREDAEFYGPAVERGGVLVAVET